MRRTSMCNPLQAQSLCPFKDMLEERGWVPKLSRVQAHPHNIVQEFFCLQRTNHEVTELDRNLSVQHIMHITQSSDCSPLRS